MVWEVLQALRAHDDQFDAMINKMDLMEQPPAKMEVIAITDAIQRKPKSPSKRQQTLNRAKTSRSLGEQQPTPSQTQTQTKFTFEVGEIERALYAKIVKKCGTRLYWEDWATDIAKIARTHIDRIQQIINTPENTAEQKAFHAFTEELRDDLNAAITEPEAIEMLAQHLITQPVFDALFTDYQFAQKNPVSQAMQQVLKILQQHHLEKERDTLQKFYASVKMRAAGIDNAVGKQKIIIELYDKFFRRAFPKMTERLGIVYTPVEVVDFILHSVNDILKSQFGQTLGSKGVHILDPFTGTGTFITRLLQSGLITKEQLKYKYHKEIHANEIVLLAYYIAAINIEAAYHDQAGGTYQPFTGICFTDTFQMYEKDDLISQLLADNSDRRKRQKDLDIRVIIGNPPYSKGQKSANDNAANIQYPQLDEKIRDTYAANSLATNKNALYDSYIRAIRWASDRVGQSGIIGFVTNAGFLDANTADGLRQCLAEDFSSIYIFHLRGNARTQGELRRKEGGNAFDSGSRAPIAISLLVKNPNARQHGQIHFCDIGDYLTRDQKLEKITQLKSVQGITECRDWQPIIPDQDNDWLEQIDRNLEHFPILGAKRGTEQSIFEDYSAGVATNRDDWAYNNSRSKLMGNIARMIDFYNAELERYTAVGKPVDMGGFINKDPKKISWSSSLEARFRSGKPIAPDDGVAMRGLYRPFTKQWLYYSRSVNHRVAQMPRIFPHAKAENRVIQVSGIGAEAGFSALMTDAVPNLHTIDSGQCFPLYLYEKSNPVTRRNGDMLKAQPDANYTRHHAITDQGLQHFQNAYPGQQISKEDLFYYIYGLLHSPDYRQRFKNNLSKQLPRIPAVKTFADFAAFRDAGRALGNLHLNFETVAMHPATIEITGNQSDPETLYRVEKMKHPKTRNQAGKLENDQTTLIYNPQITIKNIPEEAYEYIINGKPAPKWIMERQSIKTDKASNITNNANDYANETLKNPKYPLELFLRIITLSLETKKIVDNLPNLDID